MSRTSPFVALPTERAPRRALAALAIAAALALPAIGAEENAKAPRSLADAVGGDVLVYGDIDVGKMVSEWRSLDVVRMWNDSAVQEFLAPALGSMKQDLARANAMTAMLQAYGIPDTIKGKVSVAVFGVGTSKNNSEFSWFDVNNPPKSLEDFGAGAPQTSIGEDGKSTVNASFPDLVLGIQTSGRAAFEAALGRALELPGGVTSADVTVDGLTLKETRIPVQIALGFEVVAYHGFAGDTFVLSLRKERAASALKSFAAESIAQDALSQTSGFQRWNGAAARGGEVFSGYLLPAKVAKFVANVGGDSFTQIAASGLADVEGAGFSLAFEGGRLRETMSLVLPKERKGFLAMFDGVKPATPLTSAIPAGANFAIAFDLDIAALVDRALGAAEGVQPGAKEMVDQQLAAVANQIGIDPRTEIIDCLGSQTVLFAAMPKSGIIPDFGGSIAVKDEARFAALIEKVKGLAGGGSGVTFSDLPIKDRTGAFYVSIPDAPVSPAFCLADGRFHFASTGGALKKTLAKAGDAKSIATESPDFGRCLSSNVGQAGADVSGLMYVDLQKGVEFGLGFAPMALSQLPVKLDAALLPDAETLNQYISGILITTRNTNDVVVIDSSSPIGGIFAFGALASLAEPMARPAPPPVAVAPQPRPAPVTPATPAGADQPFVGIMPVPDASDVGLLVTVAPNGPAADAGVLDDDIVLKVDDLKVRTSGEFYSILKEKQVGDTVMLEIRRGEERFTIEVMVGRRGDYIQGG